LKTKTLIPGLIGQLVNRSYKRLLRSSAGALPFDLKARAWEYSLDRLYEDYYDQLCAVHYDNLVLSVAKHKGCSTSVVKREVVDRFCEHNTSFPQEAIFEALDQLIPGSKDQFEVAKGMRDQALSMARIKIAEFKTLQGIGNYEYPIYLEEIALVERAA
jgi:hypothetical protein